MSEAHTTVITPTWGLAGRFYWAYWWRFAIITVKIIVPLYLAAKFLIFLVVEEIKVPLEVFLNPFGTVFSSSISAIFLILISCNIYQAVFNKNYSGYNVDVIDKATGKNNKGQQSSFLFRFWWSNTWPLIIVSVLFVYLIKVLNMNLDDLLAINFIILAVFCFIRVFTIKNLLSKSFGPYQLVIRREEKPVVITGAA